MKFNVVAAVKVLGFVLSTCGMIASGWAGEKTNAKTIEKMVEKHFETK